MAWMMAKVAASVGDVLGMNKDEATRSVPHSKLIGTGGEMPLSMGEINLLKTFQKKEPPPPEQPDFKLETAPFDPRFPNMNQTKYCYQSYLDYHRCRKTKGEDYKPCEYFYRVYRSMCPNSWIEKWDDQLANGSFAGRI